MKLSSQEIIVGLLILGVGIASVWLAISYDDPMAGRYPTLTTTFVPVLWGGLLAFLSGIYLFTKVVQRLREEKFTDPPSEIPPEDESFRASDDMEQVVSASNESASTTTVGQNRLWLAVVGSIILLLLYSWFLREVNFLVLTTLFAFGLFELYRATSKWWQNALLAVVTSLAVYGIFVELMNIPL